VEIDGVACPDGEIDLRDDGVSHTVRVTMGEGGLERASEEGVTAEERA